MVAWIPLAHLPRSLVQRLYGCAPDFVFLIHPRTSEDIYASWPLGRRLKKLVPEQAIFRFLGLCPGYVVAEVNTPGNLRGMVVSTTLLPLELFQDKRNTLRTLRRILSFVKKLSSGRVYVGLGGWWPVVTEGGVACQELLGPEDRVVVTNGHCATLMSLYLTILKVSQVAGVSLSALDIMIVGAGRVGGSLAKLMNGKVRTLLLVDRNVDRLKQVSSELLEATGSSHIAIEAMRYEQSTEMLGTLLSRVHVTVCTTTSTGFLMREEDIPSDCLVIDDARPEAFPRVLDGKAGRVVLEGGLVKVKGAMVGKDFGFGRKENLFGCLADAYILALDGGRRLRPTVGDVDASNLSRMIEFCTEEGIEESGFMSGRRMVPSALIRSIIRAKVAGVQQEVSELAAGMTS